MTAPIPTSPVDAIFKAIKEYDTGTVNEAGEPLTATIVLGNVIAEARNSSDFEPCRMTQPSPKDAPLARIQERIGDYTDLVTTLIMPQGSGPEKKARLAAMSPELFEIAIQRLEEDQDLQSWRRPVAILMRGSLIPELERLKEQLPPLPEQGAVQGVV